MNSKRSSLRFSLEFPTLLRWKKGNRTHTLHTETKNMSSSGLYLLAGPRDRPSDRIEFEVRLPAEVAGGTGVVLSGKGRLVRREELGNKRVGFAAIIDRYKFSPAAPLAEKTPA